MIEIRAGIHQQLVRLSVPPALRGASCAGTRSVDARQRGESRDKQCDDQPREPTHAAVISTYLAV
jgi:hypothetical protein